MNETTTRTALNDIYLAMAHRRYSFFFTLFQMRPVIVASAFLLVGHFLYPPPFFRRNVFPAVLFFKSAFPLSRWQKKEEESMK